MAKIINFQEVMEERYQFWVNDYLIIPDVLFEKGKLTHIEHTLAFLIEGGVFNFQEIRDELNKNNICLNEDYFEKAKILIERGTY